MAPVDAALEDDSEGSEIAAVKPHCPMCNEPMKEHGRVFICEPCRQFIIFLEVSDTSPYVESLGQRP
jgi:hypothetical protein